MSTTDATLKGARTISVKGQQGGYTGTAFTTTFVVTIISCLDNTFVKSSITAQSYTIGATALSIAYTAWTSSLAACGTISYSSTDSAGTALDNAFITFTSGSLSYSVFSNNVIYAGTRNFKLIGTTTSTGGVVYSDFISFTITVTDPCLTATLSGTANSAQTYYVSDPALTLTVNSITSSVATLICGPFNYLAYDGIGNALNPSLFTFTG